MLYGFAAPVLIVLLASLFLLRELDTLGRSASANVLSAESIGLRHAYLNSVVDAETGLRGFQLTGDPEFLQPYESGLRNFDQIGVRLNVIEADSPDDLRKLQDIQGLFLRWRKEYAEPQIALRRQTPVGLAGRLPLIVRMVEARTERTSDTADEVREIDGAFANLHEITDTLAAGPRTDNLRTVLRLADEARSSSPEARDSGTRLLASLRTLAGTVQADEERISGGNPARQGKHLIDEIRTTMQSSLQQEVIEQNAAATIAIANTDHAIWIALLVPVAALLVGLGLTLLLLVDAIRAIHDTGRAAAAVAAGDLQERLPVQRRDEIGQLGEAFNRMADELSERERRSTAIDRFQTLLVTSNSMEEIYDVTARMCADAFPGASGAIYRIAPSRNVAERNAQWNWPEAANGRVIQPEDCRAVRSGQPYFVGDDTLEVACRHVEQLGVAIARSLCLPLTAHGEIFGVLQLCRFAGGVHGEATTRDRDTAVLIGEQLSMSLANMQLREQLRNQSIRDPLTGLFNRRYLEETMERELARTARNRQPLAVIAIDVDHFKRFNDNHGHEAGDKVLVALAGVLRGGIRSTDIACRYGGEEFVLLMPESPPAIAVERVEALRRQARELRVRVGDVQLEPISISAGIAIAPEHGESGEVLLRNADTALYAAKAAGRDRFIMYRAE
jgi:diguanylate cyclase (GGDEF)-like protein